MKQMRAHNPSYILQLIKVLKTQTANRLLDLFVDFDLWQVSQQGMMVFVYVLFEISVNEDYILFPKHHVVASQVVQQRKTVSEVIWNIYFDNLFDWFCTDSRYDVF